MAGNWRDVKAAIDLEAERIRLTPPDEIVKIFRYGIVESGAGTHRQCMSAWVFTEGDCRYLAFYGINNLLTLAQNPNYTLEHLNDAARVFAPLSAEFLGYCGLKHLYDFVTQSLDALDSLESKENFVELMSSLCLYTGTLNQWIQHYFPWNIGTAFPHRTREEVSEMATLLGI